MEEGLFMMGGVVGAAGEGEVFPAGEGGGDVDYGDGGWVEIRWGLLTLNAVFRKLGRSADVVG